MSLYHHEKHEHVPVNINLIHAAEQRAAGINAKIAVALTRIIGSMWTAYVFLVIATIGLCAILGVLTPLMALLIAWTSQTLIQLVLLPIIMVGENVVGRQTELQAEEQFNTTQHTFYDIEQIMAHLDKQDEELLKQTEILLRLSEQKQPNKSRGGR